MIVGELEQSINEELGYERYDSFFKKKTDKEKQASKEKRKAWFSNQKKNFNESGGLNGIMGTIGNIGNWWKDDTPADYDIDVGGDQGKAEEDDTAKKGISTEVWVIGGITVLALAIGVYAYSNRNKAVPVPTPATVTA